MNEQKYLFIDKIKCTACREWINENGVHKEISPENCPLYVEIQKHLGNK